MSPTANPTADLALYIAKDALAVMEGTGVGGAEVVAAEKIAELIVGIVQKGMSAYEAQTGQPLDPSLIKPFEPLP